MGDQIGIPIFPLQEMKGMIFRFRDLFNDESIHWTWRWNKGSVDQAHKIISEANGEMQVAIESGYTGYWDGNYCEAPRIYTGIITFPVEIIAKINTVNLGDATATGIFISKQPENFGSKVHYSIGYYRRDGLSINGIAVLRESYDVLASVTPFSTIPLWLRMRIKNSGYWSLFVQFDYSTDGIHWTELHTLDGKVENAWTGNFSNPGVGLYSVNGVDSIDGGSKNGVSGFFDYFRMRPASPD